MKKCCLFNKGRDRGYIDKNCYRRKDSPNVKNVPIFMIKNNINWYINHTLPQINCTKSDICRQVYVHSENKVCY